MAYQSGRHFLQIPGPTNVPDRVLRAMAAPTIDHRGPEFAVLARHVLAFDTGHSLSCGHRWPGSRAWMSMWCPVTGARASSMSPSGASNKGMMLPLAWA